MIIFNFVVELHDRDAKFMESYACMTITKDSICVQKDYYHYIIAGDGVCRSYVGMEAQSVKKDQPTMWLDLHTGKISDFYKRHVVIHEFGHILGLTHEHQRSDFWKLISPYIDTNRMKKDLNVSEKEFKIDWDVEQDLSGTSTDYDPTSIMHYW